MNWTFIGSVAFIIAAVLTLAGIYVYEYTPRYDPAVERELIDGFNSLPYDEQVALCNMNEDGTVMLFSGTYPENVIHGTVFPTLQVMCQEDV